MNDVDFVFIPLRKFQGAMKLFSQSHFCMKMAAYEILPIHIAHTVVAYHGAGSSKVIIVVGGLGVESKTRISHHVRSKIIQ